jgi:hypothetical protein
MRWLIGVALTGALLLPTAFQVAAPGVSKTRRPVKGVDDVDSIDLRDSLFAPREWWPARASALLWLRQLVS